MGSLPVKFFRGETELEDGLTDAPWLQSFGDLLDTLAGDLVLYGAAYVFLGRTRMGKPTEARRLLPTSVKPVFDEVAGLTGFTRTANGKKFPLEVADVVYIWLPNRTGELGPGPAPAAAALAAAGVLADIDGAAGNLFANGAIQPTVAFIDDNMPDAELERVESTIKRRLMGVKNALGFAAVTRKVEFATIGEYPDRLAMPELTDTKRQDIGTALGVPSSLLFSEAANYATAQQDDLNFYDKTVIPYAVRLLSAFNTQLFDRYGVVAKTAEEELELYQRQQGEQVAALATMKREGVITVNEFRERTGFAPLAELDAPAPADAELDDMPEPEANERDNELRAWQRFVVKRLKDGKALRPFHAEHIPPTLAAAIEGGLAVAESAADVKAVFQDALAWENYP